MEGPAITISDMQVWYAKETINSFDMEYKLGKVKYLIGSVDRYEIMVVFMGLYDMGYTCTIEPNTAGVKDSVLLTISK